jgi:hypothetical protein
MVSALVESIAKFGLPTVEAAVLLYILLRGDVTFRYPRRPSKLARIARPQPEEGAQEVGDKIDAVSSRRKLAGPVLYWVTVREEGTTKLLGNPYSFRTLGKAESKKFELEEAVDPPGRQLIVAIEPLSTLLNLSPPEFLKTAAKKHLGEEVKSRHGTQNN